MSRSAVRAKFGEPERSGEVGGLGLMRVEFAWDVFVLPDDNRLHVEYGEGDRSVRASHLQPPPEPEPWQVELAFVSDYYQFYVQDSASPCDTSTIWDDPKANEFGLAVGDGLVAIQTKRYGSEVPVRVEWYSSDPGFEWEGIDRVSEAGLVSTNHLEVGMPISSMTAIEKIVPGIYAVRSTQSRLATVVDDWNGSDHYIVQLWPVDALPHVKHLTKPDAH